MTKIDIVFMFIVANLFALWGLWGLPSTDVNVPALLLSFVTLEGMTIVGWLTMQFLLMPLIMMIAEKVVGWVKR